ncbi:MAG: F0F1 ATP synthase subunit B [Verrucomicrobiota bacterium]|jgi:F-type H+-transporting ATPase subunit b|nr:F0F1 ATP synthase subunit B [Verrucomicrobiota bacterium]MDP6752477.1 F0F1 ATP synthase subunit B [Verrucomicrobiota bacterium]
MLETFGVNAPLFISQLVAFIIVALLLKKFAYKPVLDMLEQRKARIAEAEANAEKIKAELAETQAERDKVMAEANQKAEKLIADAKEAARQVGEAEGQKAVKQAEEIIRKAREATEADRDRMMTELRAEVGRLVVETTAKVSGKVLTAEDQQRLIDETNREMAA